jgi:hypothetical protein
MLMMSSTYIAENAILQKRWQDAQRLHINHS